MTRLYTDNYTTTTTGGINGTVTTIPVTSVTNLPAIGGGDTCILTLQEGSTIERVSATAVSGLNLTVVRGADGSSASAFSSGVVIALRATASSYGAVGTPGGSTTEIQYNNAGAFGGIIGATTDGTALTLVAPVLGTPASGVLTNCTGLPINTGVSGLGTGVGTFLSTPSSGNLLTAVTDETGTGVLVFGTSPTITKPNLIGTITNDSPAVGSIGEQKSSTILLASKITLATSTYANITSLSLGVGDWEVWAHAAFETGPTTSLSDVRIGLSLTSAASGAVATTDQSLTINQFNAFVPGITTFSFPGKRGRFSLASTTIIYFIVRGTFTISTLKAYGVLQARRVT